MILSILNIKGGVGKTTVTTNVAIGLAKRGLSVLLLDTDSQGSATEWFETREPDDLDITLQSLTSATDLQGKIMDFAELYDCVLIDGSPHVNELAVISIAASDLIILPATPSPYDIWATEKMVHQIEQAQELNPYIQAYFLINRFSTVTLLSQEVAEALVQLGLPLLKSTLGSRVAYADSANHGLSVLEWRDRKAKAELTNLLDEILELVNDEEEEE